MKETFKEVKCIINDSGHWYIIPNELLNQFIIDESNEDLVDSGIFDYKWSQYQTRGDLNLVQLYIKTLT